MTVSGIGTTAGSLQVLRAQNAFMRVQRLREQDIQEIKDDVKVEISSKSISTESMPKTEPYSPYVNEIKAYADRCGVEDIDREDIQDALKYGTSLLADYTA